MPPHPAKILKISFYWCFYLTVITLSKFTVKAHNFSDEQTSSVIAVVWLWNVLCRLCENLVPSRWQCSRRRWNLAGGEESLGGRPWGLMACLPNLPNCRWNGVSRSQAPASTPSAAQWTVLLNMWSQAPPPLSRFSSQQGEQLTHVSRQCIVLSQPSEKPAAFPSVNKKSPQNVWTRMLHLGRVKLKHRASI